LVLLNTPPILKVTPKPSASAAHGCAVLATTEVLL